MQRIRKRMRIRKARRQLKAMATAAPVERPAPIVVPRGGAGQGSVFPTRRRGVGFLRDRPRAFMQPHQRRSCVTLQLSKASSKASSHSRVCQVMEDDQVWKQGSSTS